jgi:hypothetical protein
MENFIVKGVKQKQPKKRLKEDSHKQQLIFNAPYCLVWPKKEI